MPIFVFLWMITWMFTDYLVFCLTKRSLRLARGRDQKAGWLATSWCVECRGPAGQKQEILGVAKLSTWAGSEVHQAWCDAMWFWVFGWMSSTSSPPLSMLERWREQQPRGNRDHREVCWRKKDVAALSHTVAFVAECTCKQQVTSSTSSVTSHRHRYWSARTYKIILQTDFWSLTISN